ncbi:restriction endonuclease subunit S [Clostridium baratii]|uniref:restriction endonuclease subunit S n=1 Tax=Clostridium baratii TaxID=1561 RepID=UPI0030D4A214
MEKRNVPKLRFKGFECEWKEYKLGDFLDFYTTNSLSRDCLNNDNGKVKNIHYGDIHMKFPTVLDIQKNQIPFINDDIDISKIKEESFCKNSDLIFADASEDYDDIGKAIELRNICNSKIVAGLHTILARDNKGITASGFKGFMLLNESVRKQIKILAAGAKVLGISKTNLSKVKVKLPSLEEQSKIANFLSNVDNIIEEQEGKVKDLEQYKKGMMQKIFKQEVRFRDENGGEYPEWEEKFAGDMFYNISDKNHNGKLEVLSVTQDKGVILRKDLDIDIKFDLESVKNYKKVKAGDFIISLRSFQGGFELSNIEGIVSPAYTVFNFKEEKNNYKYFHYIFKSELFIRKLSALIYGIRDGKAISFNDFRTMKLKYPCLEEQTKIANFLSNIDNIIEKENKKLEDLKLWKKGLLQQMFV